ncbi:MAG: hypothetical protein ABIR53_02905, partial [Paraperlucidibaca sp.]
DNADGLLLPGMTAYVTIDTQERKNVLRVPTAALRFRPPEDAQLAPGVAPLGSAKRGRKLASDKVTTSPKGSVWQQTADGLKPISVTLGITDRRFTEVLADASTESALKVDDDVIIEQILSSEEVAKKGMKFRMNE